ncbi:MAG: hypothetical protein JXC32_09655 [Anaerolineae bacterium]|nr:hypothetical protein [Anaerolineae bacterium]
MNRNEANAYPGSTRWITTKARAVALAVLLPLLAVVFLLEGRPAVAVTPLDLHDTLCVTASGMSGCSTTIGAALAAANPGDTIRVATGTYTENVVISQSVTLQGGWNPNFTLRDLTMFSVTIRPADASQSVVRILAADPTVEGFVITGGRADLGGNHGGGIALRDSNAIVRDNVVISNSAFFLGGGIWVQRGAPTFEDNRIEGNLTLGLGQEAFGGGIQLENSNATLARNVVISNAIGSDGGYGGGLDIGSGTVRLSDNTFRGNGIAGVGYGGGIALHYSATVYLDGDSVEANHVDYGGGIYVNDGVLDLQNATVAANQAARNIPGAGGGLLAMDSRLTISNTTFRRNRTATGGGIFGINSRAIISRSVVISNSAVFDGGGIYNSGDVILSGVAIVANEAGGGGGGLANTGRLIIASSVLSANIASHNNGGGGALFISGAGASAGISNTLIAHNHATGSQGSGGGIRQSGGVISLTEVIVASNEVISGTGGGIANLDGGILTVERSAVYGNNAADGGGIAQLGGTATVINSTVSGNGASSQGGGLLNANTMSYSAVISLTHVTLADNSAAFGDGLAGPATAILENTIVVNNGDDNCEFPVFSMGHNLESSDTCGLDHATDLVNAALSFGPLADYGGPTPTYGVVADSPLIDAGDNTACPAVDQRGVARPIDGDQDGIAVCDIGAVEYEPSWAVYLPLVLR